MFYMDVPKIKGKMGEKGYNTTTLAKALGISRNTLSSYLAEPDKFPYDILEKLAVILFDNVEEARKIIFAQKLA